MTLRDCDVIRTHWVVQAFRPLACWPRLFSALHAGLVKACVLLPACRAPPQQASYPSTAAADSAQSSNFATLANKGAPDQAALGTAGRPHQPSSSSAAVGVPPGLGRPQQARGGSVGVQQAATSDGAMKGQPTQVKSLCMHHFAAVCTHLAVGVTDLCQQRCWLLHQPRHPSICSIERRRNSWMGEALSALCGKLLSSLATECNNVSLMLNNV